MCYTATMSKILDKALDKVKTLPTARQDQIGEWLSDIVDQDQSDIQLTPAQQEEVRRRVANPEPPLSEAEAETFFDKFT